MPIYKNYRRVYEQHYGSIPVDETGRTFEIHHKDGNRTNNDPSNLIALSIQDHFNLHLEQGDYAACLRISSRMKISPEEKSRLASLHVKSQLNNDTHPWKTESYKLKQKQRALSDLNPFIGGEIQKKSHKKRLELGVHHLVGSTINQLMMKEGRHSSQKSWVCEHCDKIGKGSTNYKRHHGLNCKTIKKI
jgi:hypothetical protein